MWQSYKKRDWFGFDEKREQFELKTKICFDCKGQTVGTTQSNEKARTAIYTRAAKSNLNSNLKELDHFAELELKLEKIFFLNSNLNLNSHKTVRVY